MDKIFNFSGVFEKQAVSHSLMDRALRLMVAGGLTKEQAFLHLTDEGIDKEDAFLAVVSAEIRYNDLLKHRENQAKFHVEGDGET